MNLTTLARFVNIIVCVRKDWCSSYQLYALKSTLLVFLQPLPISCDQAFGVYSLMIVSETNGVDESGKYYSTRSHQQLLRNETGAKRMPWI
jgi:hypothetical protein